MHGKTVKIVYTEVYNGSGGKDSRSECTLHGTKKSAKRVSGINKWNLLMMWKMLDASLL